MNARRKYAHSAHMLCYYSMFNKRRQGLAVNLKLYLIQRT